MQTGYASHRTSFAETPRNSSRWLSLTAAAIAAALVVVFALHALAQLDAMAATLARVSGDLQTLHGMNAKLDRLDGMARTLQRMDAKLSVTNSSLVVANRQLGVMQSEAVASGQALQQMRTALVGMRGDIRTMSHKISGSFLFRGVR